jgi:hypothetical protein
MALYTVFVPPEATSGRPGALDRTVLVRDSFHWLAFLFPVLWLLFNRLWLALLLFLIVSIGGSALARMAGLDPGGIGVAGLLLSLYVGFTAPEIKGWTLSRRGFLAADVVSARSREEAERRFFERWLARPARAPGPSKPVVAASHSAQPVLGLFPEAGGPR